MNKANNQTPHEVEDGAPQTGGEDVLNKTARPSNTVKNNGCMPAFEFTGFKAGIGIFLIAGYFICCGFAWLSKMLRVPFRYIHAGVLYAIFFLIAALALWLVSWTGDGALMMKSGGELLPAVSQTRNHIEVGQDRMVMEYHELSNMQAAVFLQLRSIYCQLADAKKAYNSEKKEERSEEERKAHELFCAAKRKEIFQKAKPLTGIDWHSLKNVQYVAVMPDIMEVTLVIVNLEQNTSQDYTFRLYNPAVDIAAQAMAQPIEDMSAFNKSSNEQLKAWLEQCALVTELTTTIHDRLSYETAKEEAEKLRDEANKAAESELEAARKLHKENKNDELLKKKEEKAKEINNKRVEEYFCDFVSKKDRNKLEKIILAENKVEEGSDDAANKHENEKVYIYVNRLPPSIIVKYSSIAEEPDASAENLLQLFNYSVNEFNFSESTSKNLETLFQNANQPRISPEEQREKLLNVRQRDIIDEELKKINDDKIAEANNLNKKNNLRIENEVQLVIDQRPKEMPPLTPEGEQHIREDVIKKLNIPKVDHKQRDRDSVTREEKQSWLENAYKEAGIETVNLFYNPETIECMRENKSLSSAETLRDGIVMQCMIIMLLVCAGLSLFTAVGRGVDQLYAYVRKVSAKEILWNLKENHYFILSNKIIYYIIFAGICCFLAYWSFTLYVLCDIADKVLAVIPEKDLFLPEEKTVIWLHYFCYWLPGAILGAIALIAWLVEGTKNDFCIKTGNSKIYTMLACKNANGSTTRSFYLTTLVLVLLLVLPYLVNFQYICEIKNPFAPTQENFIDIDEYNLPAGGGSEAPPKAVMIKKKKKKKIKKFVISQNTSHIFEIPDLNDDERLQEIDDATESQYTTGSMFGKGKNKEKPGWPGGIEDAEIRFIRLQYSGNDNSWNWNMGKGADYNMLVYLRDKVGLKVKSDTESVTINKLAKGFRKGKKPPFVYMTGRGSINLSNAEVKQLNEYLLKDGGMIFADSAGGSFGHHFRAMIKRVLPNHKLVDIANDDPIYKSPYFFPNGAPAFFHHDGYRAMGIKNNGRWIVFYHPGDIGDAWKGAGLTEQQQTDAFKLGANIISYAFGAYVDSLTKE